jgi:hypothetical protein
VRFDSALEGGLAFSNSSEVMFQDGAYTVPLSQVVVTLDSSLYFKDDMMGDHQAQYPLFKDTLAVADICDGFVKRFYILWAETTGDDPPIIRAYEDDYSRKEQVIGALIPPDFLGEGEGKIVNDISVLKGIDAMEIEESSPYENVDFFILETVAEGSEVETFHIYTDSDTGVSDVTHVRTIGLPIEMGEACDIELLPTNPDYTPNPDSPSLVVLFKFDFEGIDAGYLVIYDTDTGEVAEQIGELVDPSIFEKIKHLDVADGTFAIFVTALGELAEDTLSIFTYTYG